MNEFELIGEPRLTTGKGAIRRLRRAGKVPAILYGADQEPTPITMDANDVRKHLANEAFLSHILTVKLDGTRSQAVLKAVQRDPVSSEVIHMDLLRVSETHQITMHVPLHFVNEAICPGVKKGGIVTHLVVELEIRCLPKDLPEYIEVNLEVLDIGETIHMSELKVPDGVEIASLRHGADQALVSVQLPRTAEEETEAVVTEELGEEITKLVESGESPP